MGNFSYITPTSSILKNQYYNKYKVLLSRSTAEHAGEPDSNGKYRILSRMEILMPKEICTDTYLLIGCFNNKAEVTNLYKYLKTKFARFILLQSISSISLSKEKFALVPVQDFHKSWTDEELYKKYNLSENEINFIESMIKPI